MPVKTARSQLPAAAGKAGPGRDAGNAGHQLRRGMPSAEGRVPRAQVVKHGHAATPSPEGERLASHGGLGAQESLDGAGIPRVVLGARQQPAPLRALPGEQQRRMNPVLPAQTPGTWASGAPASPAAPAGHRRGVTDTSPHSVPRNRGFQGNVEGQETGRCYFGSAHPCGQRSPPWLSGQ